jgi:hypothetical protein
MWYVRYEGETPNTPGRHTGIFGLANGLARGGALSREDYAWWRASNDWIDAAYPDPGTVDATLFDKTIHPSATCWFKATADADPILARVPGYLALLDRYGVRWRERRVPKTGRILYEDPVQVISDGRP